jgi:hypothetical protein
MAAKSRMIPSKEMTVTTFSGSCHRGAMGFQRALRPTTVINCNGSIRHKKEFLPCLIKTFEALPGEVCLDPLASIS